jgi:hypothetical protein
LNPESDWRPSSHSFSKVLTSTLSSLSFQTAFVLLLGSSAAFHLPFLEAAGVVGVAGMAGSPTSALAPESRIGKFSLSWLEAIGQN